ncbi:peptidoglycan-binding protein LysM [Lutibacter sp. B1]|uniref:peptidoglycan-binding protein LysM n=1 Tax=Lutibacter sp. B1 TaxID=2725996 RepID=UPI00145700BE|nr:peptidoglycan-binding protein LysM [Lutibacter sp. B1]NLP56662.1 peptidoglycan-binding protein LysM [Lutibacter sp. B1]
MKKIIVFISLSVLVIFISSFTKNKTTNANYKLNYSKTISFVPTEEESFSQTYNIPFVGKSFNGFREALAFKESQGKYHIVNSLGYLGKYQFGKSTLKRFKIHNTQDFLNNPELQEEAFLALCSLNKWILRKDIKRNVGRKINGIEITESGILAAAHLAGAGNVKKYLRSSGKYRFQDAYGASVQQYIKTFSGYDTSFIEASKKPVI